MTTETLKRQPNYALNLRRTSITHGMVLVNKPQEVIVDHIDGHVSLYNGNILDVIQFRTGDKRQSTCIRFLDGNTATFRTDKIIIRYSQQTVLR